MEWAVGKQGEMMRPNSGKLMLPGSKIVWDIHYHAGAKTSPTSSSSASTSIPKGQEPKFRQMLRSSSASPAATAALDIPPNSINDRRTST